MICFFCLNKNLSNKKICVICQFGLFTDIWSNGFIDGIHYCINIRINLFREKYPHYAEAFNLSLKPGVDLRDYSNLLHRKNVDDRLLKQDRRSEINQIVNQEINLHLNNLFLLKKTVNFREIEVILPFLMDRISRIKCSSMAAYHRWLDEAFHDYRTTTNGWHNPEYHLSC